MVGGFGGVVRARTRWAETGCGEGRVLAVVVVFCLDGVDELDRTAFGILLPEIREDFGLGTQGIRTLVALVSVGALALQVPIAMLADRYDRVRIAWIGAAEIGRAHV